jgi:hypothetical protein
MSKEMRRAAVSRQIPVTGLRPAADLELIQVAANLRTMSTARKDSSRLNGTAKTRSP